MVAIYGFVNTWPGIFENGDFSSVFKNKLRPHVAFLNRNIIVTGFVPRL